MRRHRLVPMAWRGGGKTNAISSEYMDPFLCDPVIFGRLARFSPGWSLLAIPLFFAVLMAANGLQGTIGTVQDIERGVSDIAYALHLTSVPPPLAPYTLARDMTSWVIFAIVAASIPMIHLQWARMRDAIPMLQSTGALLETSEVSSSVEWTNLRFGIWGNRRRFTLAISVVLIVLIVIGVQRRGVFRVLAPRDSPELARTLFADAAYSGWWAGRSNPLGLVTYIVLAVVGVYAIAAQNIVGFVLTKWVWRLRKVTQFGVDPFSEDGVSGWSGAGRVLTTVYVSLFMHGLGLSLIVFIVGREGVLWIITLLLLWLVVTPTYVFVPLFAISRGMTKAKRSILSSYIAEASAALAKMPPGIERVKAEATIREGVSSIQSLRTVPLSRQILLFSAVLVQIVPVVATGVELWIATSAQ